jgi:hypothetical protein
LSENPTYPILNRISNGSVELISLVRLASSAFRTALPHHFINFTSNDMKLWNPAIRNNQLLYIKFGCLVKYVYMVP